MRTGTHRPCSTARARELAHKPHKRGRGGAHISARRLCGRYSYRGSRINVSGSAGRGYSPSHTHTHTHTHTHSPTHPNKLPPTHPHEQFLHARRPAAVPQDAASPRAGGSGPMSASCPATNAGDSPPKQRPRDTARAWCTTPKPRLPTPPHPTLSRTPLTSSTKSRPSSTVSDAFSDHTPLHAAAPVYKKSTHTAARRRTPALLGLPRPSFSSLQPPLPRGA